MTNILIISGFLGSGKTTLIETLLESMPEDTLTALVENDFGEVSADAALLSTKNITVTELSSGCVCCSLTGDFRNAVEELVETCHPDLILIEPSGIAKPARLKENLKGASFPHEVRVITVVDVNNVQKHYDNFGELFDEQILAADRIFISKVDCAKKSPEKAVALIRTLQPEIDILSDPISSVTWDRLMGITDAGIPRSGDSARNACDHEPHEHARECHDHEHHDGCGHEHGHHDGCGHEHHEHGHHDGCGHEHHEHGHHDGCGHKHHEHGHHGHEHHDGCCHHDHTTACCHETATAAVDGDFTSLTLYLPDTIARHTLEDFLEKLIHNPEILRIKGFAQTAEGCINIQYAPGALILEPVDSDQRFINIIGHRISTADVLALWRTYE